MSNRKKESAQARNLIFVPLPKLKKSPKNVRKVPHSQGGDHGARGQYNGHSACCNIPSSSRRSAQKASQQATISSMPASGPPPRPYCSWVKSKEIKKTSPIPCILDTEHNATEISLAENAIRSSMHPADEYEAFAELHRQQGMSAEDIAARFGVTPAVVRQRLKLGAVSPALLTLYREGEMTLDQLTAFTITDDHARQEQVWADLGFNNSRRAILQALTEGQIEADDRRVAFVGIEAYEAAGGTVIRDLFDEDGGYLADAALLNRLTRRSCNVLAESGHKRGLEAD